MEWVERAEKSMALLRQAGSVGYRNPDPYQTESALDALRNRNDFKLLMIDLSMPAEPFAVPE